MLLEKMPVCIKGQIKITFIVPFGLGRVCRARWFIPGFHEAFCPFPQPTTMRHFTRSLEGRGASVDHRGIPLGTWMVAGGTEEGWLGRQRGVTVCG